VNHTALPHGVDPGQDAQSALLAAYRESARQELLNYFGTRPDDMLDTGTVDQLEDWLLRRWAVGLAGFDNANPAATRQLVRALDFVLQRHPEIVVREGSAITVREVAGGNGVEMMGRRDGGRVVVESITVDPGCLFGAIHPGQRLDLMVVGAVGGVLVDAGNGTANDAFWYLLRDFVGLPTDPTDLIAPPLQLTDSLEAEFESVVRQQLGERALPAVTPADQIWRRTAASQRFDPDQAARAAVFQVDVRGWHNASNLARAMYRLVFARVQERRRDDE
jgi:hypothetical protein